MPMVILVSKKVKKMYVNKKEIILLVITVTLKDN